MEEDNYSIIKEVLDNHIAFKTPCKLVCDFEGKEKPYVFSAKRIIKRDDNHILILNKFDENEPIPIKNIKRVERWEGGGINEKM